LRRQDLSRIVGGDCAVSRANRQDLASKPIDTGRKKQGYGLATVPFDRSTSQQTDDYTLFGRRGS